MPFLFSKWQLALRMIALGADVNVHEPKQPSLLHVAAARGNRCMVELLLWSGADPSAKDEIGHSPDAYADLNREDGGADVHFRLRDAKAEIPFTFNTFIESKRGKLDQTTDTQTIASDLIAARTALAALPSDVFNEMIQDV